MDSKEYFETYKDKIKETAEFLCSKDPSKNLEDEFEKLKQQYLNCDGTCHSKIAKINDVESNIGDIWVEDIRHEEIENFVIYGIGPNGYSVIYKTQGDQFSSPAMDLDDIDKVIVKAFSLISRNLGVFIVHNHPYIYKATPSTADLNTLAMLKIEFDRIVQNANSMGMKCDITIVDFAIVTEFDYWSFKQA